MGSEAATAGREGSPREVKPLVGINASRGVSARPSCLAKVRSPARRAAYGCYFNLGRAVPQTAIAATTTSQNGTTPTPGIASRTSPGNSSHRQPSTVKSKIAVTKSTAHTIGGARP